MERSELFIESVFRSRLQQYYEKMESIARQRWLGEEETVPAPFVGETAGIVDSTTPQAETFYRQRFCHARLTTGLLLPTPVNTCGHEENEPGTGAILLDGPATPPTATTRHQAPSFFEETFDEFEPEPRQELKAEAPAGTRHYPANGQLQESADFEEIIPASHSINKSRLLAEQPASGLPLQQAAAVNGQQQNGHSPTLDNTQELKADAILAFQQAMHTRAEKATEEKTREEIDAEMEEFIIAYTQEVKSWFR